MIRLDNAREFILQKLSTGLSRDLHYHCIEHVLDVLESAQMLANEEGVSEYEKELLSTAALFHDSGFIFQTKDHEERGCEIVRGTLPSLGYTDHEIEVICGMVMATKIPQNPKNQLEEIICDADLDYLGRDDFWEIGNKLYLELKIMNVVQTKNDWNRIQVKFLEAHRYFTETAIRLRADKKAEHLKAVKHMVV